MSELIYRMKCPNLTCNSHKQIGLAEYMFSGSGTKGECMNCGHTLNPKIAYKKFEGYVISYNG